MPNAVNRTPAFGIRVDGSRAWILSEHETGRDIGLVTYQHDRHGNHYHAWLLVDGGHKEIGTPSAQLAQAARVIEDEIARLRSMHQD